MKSILMIISSSPHSPHASAAIDLVNNLNNQGNKLAVFLLQDGVFHAISGEGAMKALLEKKIDCYYLEEDLIMRGFQKEDAIAEALPSGYEGLDDLMMEKYNSTIGAF